MLNIKMPIVIKMVSLDMITCAKVLGAAIATVGVAGSGIGIGVIFGGFFIAVSKHPNIEKSILPYVILGFALSESMAIFSLMMAFLLLYS
jgi:F-type H+-transporting ATPase subunit c